MSDQQTYFAELSERTQIEVTGRDRTALLGGLCTADLKRLEPGQGAEAFFTNLKGKTIGYAYLFCGEESIVIDTAPGQTETLLAHLDRYIIREDVELHDRGQEWGEWLVLGDGAEQLLSNLIDGSTPKGALDHTHAAIGGLEVWLRRTPYAGMNSFFIACTRQQSKQVQEALQAAGAAACASEAVEAARIEAGTPLYGQDITEANLPQEVNRNEQAISFTKGCYLGQETVARLDALGHVNQLLVGVRFSGDSVPQPGEELTAGEKKVGRVTSAALSPTLDAPLALAYVRRMHNKPGATLQSEYGEAEVVELPVRE